MNKGTLKQIIHTYINIYTYKHTLNIYTLISIQITLSISIVKLDNRVAELHFIIEWSGEKIKNFLNLCQNFTIHFHMFVGVSSQETTSG